MKKHLISIVLLLLLLPMSGFSQEKRFIPRPTVEYMLRAKALGMVIIEDLWVHSFSIGSELRFYEQFSLVADLVHFRWRYEEEVHDLPDPEEYNEYSQYDPRNYLAIELRYYPTFLKTDYLSFYVNTFTKFGNRRVYNQDKYPISDGAILRLHSSFYDLGFSAGFEGGEAFGVDVSLGTAYRKELKTEEIFHDNAPTTFIENTHHDRWVPTIRVNFYWNFGYN